MTSQVHFEDRQTLSPLSVVAASTHFLLSNPPNSSLETTSPHSFPTTCSSVMYNRTPLVTPAGSSPSMHEEFMDDEDDSEPDEEPFDEEDDRAEEALDQPGPSQSKPKRKGKKKDNPLISATEKCKVCLEPAAKHIHYGSVTCFSCRAFFRRSIQNKSGKVYTCRKQGNCNVTNKLRKSCQKCRFDKCLEVKNKNALIY